jgi:hypothetical protein
MSVTPDSSTLKIASDSLDSGPSYPFLNINKENTINNLFDSSDNKSFAKFLEYIIFKRNNSQKSIIKFEIDERLIILFLEDSFSDLIIPYENAYFYLDNNEDLNIYSEQIGKDIDYELVINDLEKNIVSLKNNRILLKTKSIYPIFKKEDIYLIKDNIEEILKQGSSLSLKFNSSNEIDLQNIQFSIPTSEIISWIGIKENNKKAEIFLDNGEL